MVQKRGQDREDEHRQTPTSPNTCWTVRYDPSAYTRPCHTHGQSTHEVSRDAVGRDTRTWIQVPISSKRLDQSAIGTAVGTDQRPEIKETCRRNLVRSGTV